MSFVRVYLDLRVAIAKRCPR